MHNEKQNLLGWRVRIDPNALTLQGNPLPHAGEVGTVKGKTSAGRQWRVQLDSGAMVPMVRDWLQLLGERDPRHNAHKQSSPKLHTVDTSTITWSNGRRAVLNVQLSTPTERVLPDFSPWKPKERFVREGAQDFLRYPSRMGNALVYPDGRKEVA